MSPKSKKCPVLENYHIYIRSNRMRNLHIQSHAKFEEDLLNTSTVIGKRGFEQRGMLHKDYQTFGPEQNCQDAVAIGTHYTKG